MANRNRKTKFIITEIPGTRKIEDVVAEPLVKYINERAGRAIVTVGKPGEPTIFEEIIYTDTKKRE